MPALALHAMPECSGFTAVLHALRTIVLFSVALYLITPVLYLTTPVLWPPPVHAGVPDHDAQQA
jgi:hypothetical protein